MKTKGKHKGIRPIILITLFLAEVCALFFWIFIVFINPKILQDAFALARIGLTILILIFAVIIFCLVRKMLKKAIPYDSEIRNAKLKKEMDAERQENEKRKKEEEKRWREAHPNCGDCRYFEYHISQYSSPHKRGCCGYYSYDKRRGYDEIPKIVHADDSACHHFDKFED